MAHPATTARAVESGMKTMGSAHQGVARLRAMRATSPAALLVLAGVVAPLLAVRLPVRPVMLTPSLGTLLRSHRRTLRG